MRGREQKSSREKGIEVWGSDCRYLKKPIDSPWSLSRTEFVFHRRLSVSWAGAGV